MSRPEKTRLRRDELKALVLEAGGELLREDGLGAKTAPIGYADSFRWLKEHHSLTISRAQVHRRIWDSLEEYRYDVLMSIATYAPGTSFDETVEELRRFLGDIDLSARPAAERQELLTDLAVRMTEANADSIRGPKALKAFDAIYVMFTVGAMTNPDTSGIRQALYDNSQSVIDRFDGVYRHIIARFNAAPGSLWGLSIDEGLAMFAELISCLSHGSSGRSVIEHSLQKISIGADVWSVEGLGAAAFAHTIAMIDGPGAKSAECGSTTARLGSAGPKRRARPRR